MFKETDKALFYKYLNIYVILGSFSILLFQTLNIIDQNDSRLMIKLNVSECISWSNAML